MLKQIFSGLLIITAGTAMAQSVEEARQFLYYDRLTSAENTLKQVMQKDPGNTEVYYWLFQTKLQQGDTTAAKQVLDDVQQLQQTNDKIKIDPLVRSCPCTIADHQWKQSRSANKKR